MCFSQPASAGFAVMGIATGVWLRSRGHPFRRYQIFLWFALMEIIQTAAYSVVDQCDNPVNIALTAAAYLHVMFQNVPVNLYFLSPENGVHPDVLKLVLWMASLGGAMGFLVKLPWPVWLGASPHMLDRLAATLPEFFSFTQAGTEAACRFETMCGPRVCTISTPRHIAWMMPILPPSYFLPSGFLHFFFFFFPTVIMVKRPAARLAMFAALLTGPLLTQWLAAHDPATYKYEWPATWCYASIAQCTVALVLELMWPAAGSKASAARGRANGAKANGVKHA
ncbi:hypothetical protein HT031_002207 [Scenedesmus sp. PABB004]|nr:hypothetical protein HT031_002207 [Scenedesmus sp. PABB004]